ncbi:MFS transporter [Nonomuraea muscovyensis]|uniref:EmrB/QacA subfamily drug resistance transporter n=1 Tax=Nonomuraea muscovyensis TaxID=1124761 RepID=A0A7X0BX77_9ACTN|nr:MFS transporter [Nonomuraea muscovyensis]MBB6344500.1 EmrB/QacA subfamily drug resistance transporter [Nonomuraea muscovyensis]
MRAVLPGLLLAMLLGALDQTVMAPALPAAAGDLGGLDQMSAVVTAYLVAATVVMPVYGKLGDRFGRKPVMQAAIVIFVAGAVLCGLAGDMGQFVAFRAVQGVGGGGLMIGAQAIIGELVSPRERGRYLGLIGAAYVVAAVGGPLWGGLAVDRLDWRWIFAVYPPLGLVALVLLTVTLRLPAPSAERGRAPVDYLGALTLAVAVVGIVLLGQTREPAFLAVAAAGALAWLVSARRAADPILPLRLFRDRAFAVPVAISLLIGFALFGTITYLPAYLQIALGSSATQAGLLVTALMAGVLVTTVVSGRLITRTGRYKPYPVAGTALATAGLGLLAFADGAGAAAIAGVMLLIGLGVGLVMQVVVTAAQNAVGHADLGTATSTVTFLRQVGASAGVALTGALITWRTAGDVSAADPAAGLPDGVRAAFAEAVPPVLGAMAPLMAVAFVLALALPARPLRTTAYVEEHA